MMGHHSNGIPFIPIMEWELELMHLLLNKYYVDRYGSRNSGIFSDNTNKQFIERQLLPAKCHVTKRKCKVTSVLSQWPTSG